MNPLLFFKIALVVIWGGACWWGWNLLREWEQDRRKRREESLAEARRAARQERIAIRRQRLRVLRAERARTRHLTDNERRERRLQEHLQRQQAEQARSAHLMHVERCAEELSGFTLSELAELAARTLGVGKDLEMVPIDGEAECDRLLRNSAGELIWAVRALPAGRRCESLDLEALAVWRKSAGARQACLAALINPDPEVVRQAQREHILLLDRYILAEYLAGAGAAVVEPVEG